jgi:DNA polymerase III epsilon subunit-like protein
MMENKKTSGETLTAGEGKTLLFFDVECANCQGGAKLYSFGYVLSTEDFEIIKKEDFLINPRVEDADWDWYVLRNISEKNIKKQLRGKPDFATVFPIVRSLLENPDNIVFGFSVDNDFRYIDQDAERYNFPPVATHCFDLQGIYSQLYGGGAKGLSKVITELSIDCTDLREHVSCDDACVTMRVLQAICNREQCTVWQLLKKFRGSRIDSIKYWNSYRKKLANR